VPEYTISQSPLRHTGLFITFEGPDGCGKSTQMRTLAERLRSDGHGVLESAEPGGTRIGQLVRRILLDAANQELQPTAEMLLYFACRAQNVDEWILPALADGRIVLSDRFTDSTLVYQGVGRGLGAEKVRILDAIACRGLVPDLTVVVDIEVEQGLARVRARNTASRSTDTRMDEQAVEFHKRVREGYLHLAQDEPKRVRIVDGSGDIESVSRGVWDIVQPALRGLHV
jgi:dTMP kinase